jgi:hypothetical protein
MVHKPSTHIQPSNQNIDSSFSESFYGLKRMRLLKKIKENMPPQYRPLKLSDRRRALFTLVLWPYLRSKLDTHYKNLVDPTRADMNVRDEEDMVAFPCVVSIFLIY